MWKEVSCVQHVEFNDDTFGKFSRNSQLRLKYKLLPLKLFVFEGNCLNAVFQCEAFFSEPKRGKWKWNSNSIYEIVVMEMFVFCWFKLGYKQKLFHYSRALISSQNCKFVNKVYELLKNWQISLLTLFLKARYVFCVNKTIYFVLHAPLGIYPSISPLRLNTL